MIENGMKYNQLIAFLVSCPWLSFGLPISQSVSEPPISSTSWPPLPPQEILDPAPEPEVDPLKHQNCMRFPDDRSVKDEEIQYNAVVDAGRLWLNGRVPYVMDRTLPQSSQQAIQGGMLQLSSQTGGCIQFVPRTTETDYVTLRIDDGCYSYVGRTGGSQTISIDYGCEAQGIVIHELLHALGFYHEHNRSDRDSYVTIVTSNIETGYADNFEKLSPSRENTLGIPYDYLSIMHYSRDAFSRNDQDTIITKDPQYQNIIGQRGGMSSYDVEEVRRLYNCNAPPTQPPPPTCVDADQQYCSLITNNDCNSFPNLRNAYCRCRCASAPLPAGCTYTDLSANCDRTNTFQCTVYQHRCQRTCLC